jgi:hypothetical protein
MTRPALDLTLLGVGAMNSPRFGPAGLLVAYARRRVVIDGGPGAEPSGPVDAWLTTDDRSELRGPLRRLAATWGLEPMIDRWHGDSLTIDPRPVIHTSHPTVGYLIEAPGRRAAWAPEFWTFPEWAAGADLLFADAAGWDRPIRFAGGVGGHAAALQVAEDARTHGVRRLVLAHIGKPTIRAIDRGDRPPFGEFGSDGRHYRL